MEHFDATENAMEIQLHGRGISKNVFGVQTLDTTLNVIHKYKFQMLETFTIHLGIIQEQNR